MYFDQKNRIVAVRQLRSPPFFILGPIFIKKNRSFEVVLYILIGFEDVKMISHVFWPEKSNDDILEA